MKEVIVVLKEESCQAGISKRFRDMSEALSQQGITSILYSTREWGGNHSLPDKDGLLWITDSSVFLQRLFEQKLPRIAYFHESNETEDLHMAEYAVEEAQDIHIDFLENAYRRYRRIPWDILTTDRCMIRETTPEDIDTFYQIYNQLSAQKFIEELYPNVQDEKEFANQYIDQVYGFFGFGIWTVLTKEGEIIGRAGLFYRDATAEPELGFMIAPSHQRRGYGEEICRAILQFGVTELEFEQITAIVDPLNTASIKLCYKLGFITKDFIELQEKRYMRMIYTCPT
jgi:RimJ/RimL family protein N-acetyltransferase